MTNSVPARLYSIETKRILLQQRVSELEPHVVSARPRPDKWSILEIVEHLVLSERVVFRPLDSRECAVRGTAPGGHEILGILVGAVGGQPRVAGR